MTNNPAKAPKVWRDLTQAALDNAYDQSVYAANMATVAARYGSNSDIARSRLSAPERIAYGPGPKSAFDLYRTAGDAKPIQIFVHGGAWKATTAAHYAFLAECFIEAGAHLTILDFDWVQDHNGDLMPIADQITDAILWIAHNARQIGGDPDQIYLSGHSSGSHMAAVALTRTETSAPKAIKGAVLASGMFDMAPVRLSARSAYVSFTDASAAALSPLRHINKIATPILLAYGELETPEFIRQSNAFDEALTDAGKASEIIIGRNYNHFEIIETLANPYGLLGAAALSQMGLRG